MSIRQKSNAKWSLFPPQVYTFVVITVCLKASLEMDAWNYLTHLSIWGSIAFWAVFICAYSYAWPAGLPIASNMAGIYSG